MPDIRILTETDARGAIDLSLEVVDRIDDTFRRLAAGGVVLPPILSMAIAEHHGEVDPAAFARVRYVPDRLRQTRESGELRAAIAAGVVAPAVAFAELGDVLSGATPGRSAAADVTLADLTGTGVQDTAIATLALECTGDAGTSIAT